ncbi:peptide ABC transporter substrate-binding protein [Corynebacterium heidelbergense]|uniref:ABC transporter substrate-binding protein n=1 Tax=Corynebacterium heidelbergense TaxID=2055947 RepID=A0A364VAI8_9CORY|nr:ABC transporter substrate-binding protein [Corynebacterium heidelbergense]RAV33655.1 ABC transporter substrate-binding protein [Corynebacterium heidelbergense]WCZ37095.1 Oligopeptide-binding protein OppA precursor [Corynebacterium heidelbergense]
MLAVGFTAALAGGGLTACGGSDSGGSSDNVISTDASEPQNPLVTTNTNENGGGRVLDELYSGLVRYTSDGKTENAVAESITPNTDATEFTFKLRDWKFTNGEKVTSDSFIDAWNYGAAAKNAQLQADFFSPIKGYEEVSAPGSTKDKMSGLQKVSDTEFKVVLNDPESAFPDRLGHAPYMPLPKAAFQDMKSFGEHPIGNGPYKLVDKEAWVHNQYIKLEANPDYPGPNKAKNGGIEFKIYNNLDTAYADLQSNNLDITYQTVPSSAMATYRDDFPKSHSDSPFASIQTFSIPSRLEHFGNDEEGKLRREALSMAVNRKLITDKIFSGGRTPAKDFGAPTLGDGTPNIEGNDVLDYNADKAKELWKKADAIKPWSGTFEIAYNSDGGHKEWVEAVTNDISQNLGIEAHGKAYPTFKALRDDVTKKTISTAFRTGWQADYPSIFNFLSTQYATDGPSNDTQYSSKEFDDLLAKASAETDKAKAQKDYNDAQAVLMKDLPAIPLWYYNATDAWNEDLKGVKYNWKGAPVFTEIEKG